VAPLSDEPAFQHVLTASERVQQMLRLCSKVAPSPYTVLFTGETGVGKGLLAKTVHRLSPRRDESLVSVNCAAIPETLLESELFGHVRGAFTGADRDRDGLILNADKGTLFLDEVGKMSLPMQAKLLHFLDTREIRAVGGSAQRKVDVRVICASKRDLEQLVEQGLFLEDLYYRLLDFPIEVPPLRERDDDVLLLAEHYVEKSAAELGRQRPKMTRGFAARLRAYRWPGNVRQLEKVIQRACILAQDDDRLRESHLAPELRGGMAGRPDSEEATRTVVPLKERVAELEQREIQTALDRVGWNRSKAARELEISYPTLLQKIRLYDLNPLS
jgi:two-component system response regulator AtoC